MEPQDEVREEEGHRRHPAVRWSRDKTGGATAPSALGSALGSTPSFRQPQTGQGDSLKLPGALEWME